MPMIPVDTAVVLIVGPVVDDTDFKSLEEAVAYDAGGMDVSLLQWDGNSPGTAPTATAITLTSGGANDWAHIDGGYYSVEITAAQNDTEGLMKLRGIATGVLAFESVEYDVVPQQVYNSLALGTDDLDVQVTGIDASAITAASIATDAIGSDELAASAVNEIWAGRTGTRSVTITSQETDATAVPTVALSIYSDSGGTVLITKVTTDTNGDVTVGLEDGTYYVTPFKSAYSATTLQSIVITGNDSETVTIDPVSATPSNPDGCVITGGVKDVGFQVIAGSKVIAYANTSGVAGTGVESSSIAWGNEANQYSTTVDGSGNFSLEVPQGINIILEIPNADIKHAFTVPAQATRTLTQILAL